MKRVSLIRVFCISAVLIACAALSIHAGSMGTSGGYDLDGLWANAQNNFKLSENDAVLLIEAKHVSISSDKDQVTRIHRVVWIGTELGIDHYADLRVPWNSATSTLNVVALRTWRDDAWWPDETEVSETAVVETLPFALASADDYTSMRETMLLHDGVELPCIMETIYEIRERGAAMHGSDDLFVFSNNDPAVLVEYTLTTPDGVEPIYHCGNGAPEPSISSSNDGATTYIWKMVNVGRRGSPHIEDPAVHEPYVTWSTWRHWMYLGDKLAGYFDGAATIEDPIADTLAEYIEHEPTLAAKARKITGFVNEYTRGIDYDSRFWKFSPRPATRTFETAYGHSLDRAVLAAALFREVGLQAEPALLSIGPGGIDQDIPGLSRFGDIVVWVSNGRFKAIYDPVSGTLREDPRVLDGRSIWNPKGREPINVQMSAGLETESRFELILTLEPGSGDDWSGTGYFYADGALCPYDEMTGLDSETMTLINKIIGSVLPGSSAGGYNLEYLESTKVSAGFDFTYKPAEPDDFGRTAITVGDPADGIIDALPADVHLYDERRTSPVLRFGTHGQRIRLRFKTGDREIVHLPEPSELGNGAGRFELKIIRDGEWVTIERFLKLDSGTIPPRGMAAIAGPAARGDG